MIVHIQLGSRHVVKPSVVMILVSSTRSSHTCEESWILMKPPSGSSWSRNQLFPITSGVSCSRRSPGSCADVGIEGTSHRMLLRMNSEPFLSIGLLTTSGLCIELCPEGSISLLHSLCSSVSVCSRLLLQHTRFSSESQLNQALRNKHLKRPHKTLTLAQESEHLFDSKLKNSTEQIPSAVEVCLQIRRQARWRHCCDDGES